ncbi:EamA family transporter [uncultured Brachyspira sp.]|uniref:EamA family transporter n=1 Tax=uncultured Brachyspira sp. TaxID=221953 RepID=UPI002632E5FF|nr:EamA family transporter [uncultured Brachyspira sp.]
MYILFALLSSIFAALTAILIKIGLSNINSNLATAIRTIIILIMSWIIVFYTNKNGSVIETIKNINSKTLIFIILSGIATGLSWIFYFKALQIGNVNKAAVIDKLSIVFTIILASIFLKEALTLKVIIGAVFILAGTLIITL